MTKVRLLIEYEEDLDGHATTRCTVLSPEGFPIGTALLVGILELAQDATLRPGEEVEYGPEEEDEGFKEFRRKINAVIDEYIANG